MQAQRELSLDEALALAIENSETLTIARAGVQRAEANVRLLESQRLPQINGSASYQRTLASQFSGLTAPGGGDSGGEESPGVDFTQFGFGAPNTWNLGINFNWLLFNGGRTEAQIRAAQAQVEAADAQLASAEAQTRLDVTQAYFDAQLAAELVHISQMSLENSEETLRLTQLRANAGTQAEFDVLQARVGRDNQRPLLIQRETSRDLAFERLRTLLDLPSSERLTLTTPVTSARPRDITPSNLDRIPVQQAGTRLIAAREQVDAARAQRWPALSVTSQYGLVAYSANFFPPLDSFRDNWVVGAAVSVPIYTGGRIGAEIDLARAGVTEAQAQLDQTVEASRLDTESALAALRSAEATWQATASTVAEAERGYEIAKLRYREGVSIQLEIENARLLLEQARANRAQAARDLWIAQTRLELLPYLPFGTSTGAMTTFSTTSATSAITAAPTGASTFSGANTGGFPQQ
jgi:outer membrane protein TolC